MPQGEAFAIAIKAFWKAGCLEILHVRFGVGAWVKFPGPHHFIAGSVAGGERTAGFMMLVSSALRSDLDVWRYVKDVLDQLLAGQTNYEPLLPWNWAAANSDAIREYRVGERKDRAERKPTKRADRRKRRKVK